MFGLKAPQARLAGLRPRASRCVHASAAPVNGPASQAQPVKKKTSFHHGVVFTYYEGNSVGIKFNNTGVRVLIDPWLVDDLVFLGQDWLYRGKKKALYRTKVDVNEIASETDVVVVTQWLDDHCHIPTLKALPKHLPVVTNAEAAERIRPLGYKDIRIVDHGQTVEVASGRMKISATVGALVGPPWSKRQNGLVFREVVPSGAAQEDVAAPASLYYESHCDFVPESVAKVGKVDVVVSPITTTLVGVSPVGYPVVLGDTNLQALLKLLQPKVLVPLMNADINQEGPLSSIVQERGSVDQARQQLRQLGLDTRMEMPAPPGEALAIAL